MKIEVLSATKTAQSVLYSDVNLDVNTESVLELVYNEDSINKSSLYTNSRTLSVFTSRFTSE